MNMKWVFLVGILSAALPAQVPSDAAPALLKAKSVTTTDQTVVAKDATVIFKDTKVEVTAPEITVEKFTGNMKCRGETTIRANGVTLKAHDVAIEGGGRRVFWLREGTVSAPAAEAGLPVFSSPGSLRPKN